MKKKVLFLGATGRIGPGILDEYEKHYKNEYEFIIGSRREITLAGYKTVLVDYLDIENLKKAMKGVSVVLNLGAQSDPKASFDELIEPNIIGTYNVFEAARQAGCERVIFASSVHAIRGYPFGHEVRADETPKPSGLYGASKVFGEGLCYVFSQNHALSCLAIRIGAYVSDKEREKVCLSRDNYDYVISQRDLAQLIHKCIVAPQKVMYAVLPGISNNKKKYMNLDEAKKLIDYHPQDDAFEFCEKIKKMNAKKN